MNVGDRVWWFDQNKRVYERDEKGRPVGRPIWREHWRELAVIGETRVSWLVGYPGAKVEDHGFKLPKRDFADGKCPSGWALSLEHIEERSWVEEHRWQIGDALDRCEDPAVLRQVAALVGYAPKPRV